MKKQFFAVLLIFTLVVTATAGVSRAQGPDADPDPVTPAQTNPEVHASWRVHPPTVDGDLSDWNGVSRIYLTRRSASYAHGSDELRDADLSGWISVLWTSYRVYLAFSVTDEYVVRQSRNLRNDDMLSVVFDVDQSGEYNAGDVVLTFSPDNVMTVNGGWPAGYEWSIHETATGWQGEASIPMHEFGDIDFLGDVEVGFNWGLQDNDGIGVESWLSWAGPEYLKPTPEQALLQFTDGPVRRWVAFHPGVDGYDGLVDTAISRWHIHQNYGEDPRITLYSRNQYHLLLKFDIPDLGQDVRVLDARVHLYFYSRNHEWTSLVRIYRLLRPWDEATATWVDAAADTPWGKMGADAIGVDRSDQVIGVQELTDLGWVTFDLADGVAEDIYTHPDQNYGIIFRAEEGSSVAYNLYSSESDENAPWIEVYAEFPPDATR